MFVISFSLNAFSTSFYLILSNSINIYNKCTSALQFFLFCTTQWTPNFWLFSMFKLYSVTVTIITYSELHKVTLHNQWNTTNRENKWNRQNKNYNFMPATVVCTEKDHTCCGKMDLLEMTLQEFRISHSSTDNSTHKHLRSNRFIFTTNW